MWIDIRDFKNSNILVGCVNRAPDMREEQERGVREKFGKACGK